MQLRLFLSITFRLVMLPALCSIAIAAPASAQVATPTANDASDPATLTEALATAEPPSTLPGYIASDLELVTWEEYYGEDLDGAEGAWLLDGSLDFPLATMIVFSSSENAGASIGDYRQLGEEFKVGELDAWTIADRGKWICITATGPMVVIGQAFPENIDEAEEVVEERSCEVVEATLSWLSDNVLEAPLATPSASPASDPED